MFSLYALDAVVRYRLDYFIFIAAEGSLFAALHVWMKRTQKHAGIRRSIRLLAVILMIAAGFLTEAAGLHEKNQIKKMIQGFAPTYADEFSRLHHEEINFSTSPQDPLYLKLIETEIRWLKLNPLVHDIYTFRKLPDGRSAFLVDSETDYDHNGRYEGERESRTSIGEIFKDAELPAVKDAYRGATDFDPKPYTDRWGSWVSAFSPIRNSKTGAMDAVVGVDYAASAWLEAILLQRLGALCLMAIPILLLLGFAALISIVKASEIRFRSLVSNIPGAIYRYENSPAPGYSFFSRQIEDITGYPASEFLGGGAQRYDDLILNTERSLVRRIRQKLLEKKQPYTLEYPIQNKKGLIRWVCEKGQAIADEEGRNSCRDGAIFDITQQKELEEQLSRQKRMDAIAQLAGSIAHDFNNLLTVVNGHAELAHQNIMDELLVRRSLGEIVRAGRRAAFLTNRLLAYAGKQIRHMEIFEADEFIVSMKETLRQTAGPQIELIFTLENPGGKIQMSPSQLEQILINLLNNCREAMGKGGKVWIETRKICVGTEDPRVQEGLVPGDFGMIVVRDNGPGIPSYIKENLFEPFYSTKERGSGSGMGLPAVFGMVRQNRGHIRILSEPGWGTSVEILIPKSQIFPGSSETAAPEGRNSETVLIVDDEDMIISVIQNMLQRQGFKVMAAANVKEALWKICTHEKNIPQLALLDVSLPGVAAKKLAEKIYREKPGVKILYISGYDEASLIQSGLLDPMEPFLQKPFSAAQLVYKIREVLNER